MTRLATTLAGFLLFAFLLSTSAFAQTPDAQTPEPQVVDPQSGEPVMGLLPPDGVPDAQRVRTARVAQADEITLRSYLRAGATRVVRVEDEVMYLNNGTQLQSFDISDPASPQLLSSAALPALVSDLALGESLAFVATSQTAVVRPGTGLRIIDISNPENLQEVGALGNRPGYAVAAAGDYAYLGEGFDGLSVIDVSNPSAPVEVSRVSTTGSANGVDLDGDLLCVATGNAGLLMVDVSDPASPVALANLPTGDFATYCVLQDDFVYLATGFGLSVVDVSNPAAPVEVGTYATSNTAFEVALSGDTAYVAAFTGGLLALDVSDPANPILIDAFESGGSAFGVDARPGQAFLAERFEGVRVLDASETGSLTTLSFVPGAGFSTGAAIGEGVAYVVDLAGGMRLIDLSDPDDPAEISRIDTPSNTQRVAVQGEIAYVVDANAGPSGLTLIDIADPSDPELITTFDTGSQAFGIDVVGETAYIANGFGGTIGVDVSDPANPTLLFTHPGLNVRAVEVVDGIAYAVKFGSGLTALDVSDPENVTEVGSFVSDQPYENFISGIDVAGEVAYLATGGGLVVLDVSDPSSIQKLGGAQTPSLGPRDVVYDQGRVYLTEDFLGVRLYDVTDPANPVELDFFPSAARAIGLAKGEELVTFAAGGGGVYFFDLDDDPDDPAIAVDPQSLDFGEVPVGGSNTLSLTITNTGSGTLEVTSITSDHPDFTVDFDGPFTIEMQDSTQVAVTFSPEDVGVETGTLSIESNDPANPTVTVALEGEGVPASGTDLVVTPEPGPDSTRTVAAGSEFLVPITVEESLDGLGVQSYQFTLTFDSTLFAPVGVETDGTLSEDVILAVNAEVPGQISVAAADTTGVPQSDPVLFVIEGEGTLIFVQLQAKEELGASELAFTEFLFNEGDPPVTTETTTYEVGVLYGDVSDDGEVTIFDAALVLRYSVGLEDLTEAQLEAGDVSGNGNVTAFDASLIARFALDMIECFPVEEGCELDAMPALALRTGAAGAAPVGAFMWSEAEPVSLSGASGAARAGAAANVAGKGQLVEVPLVLDAARGPVFAVQLRAQIDPQKASVEAVEAQLPEDWHMAHHTTEEGLLRIAMAGPTPLEEGQIATLRLRLTERAGGPVFSGGLTLEGQVQVNEARPAQLQSAQVEAIPAEFEVSGNYPNPFSGRTEISLNLPEDAEVTLEVYDALGRRVMQLDRQMEAGTGRVLEVEARSLPAGVYFYRVMAETESGRHSDSGQMVLVK